MASQGVAASSRLAQMQLKFQQKQIQERELRRIEMTGERSDSIETSEPSKKFGNGKVRQMFDERRRGAGIDRSNPLKPLMTTSKSSTTTNSTSSTAAIRSSGAAVVRRQPAAAGMQTNGRRNLASTETLVQSRSSSKNSLDTLNGNFKRNQRKTYEYNTSPGDEELLSKGLSSLSLGEQSLSPPEFGDRNNNNNNQKSDFARVPSSNSIKLKPVLTKKSTLSSSSRTFSNPTTSPLASPTKTSRTETDSSALRKTHTSTVKTSQKSSVRNMSFVKMGEKPMSQAGPPPAGMATCKICHRNFNADRLEKHEQACQKMASSKRKIFDASKARVKGTEAEKYLKKPIRSGTNTRTSMTYTSTAAATGMTLPANSGLKKNNWRKKHEEFIAAIRAAKQVKIHLAKGGKLSDLPPPPPSENPDYVQCPHCSRRFNEAAAERHIPKCATMLHNKPKPAAVNKRKA